MDLTTSYVVNGDDLPVNNINDLLPVHDDSIHSDGPGIPVGSKVLAQQRKVLLTEMGTAETCEKVFRYMPFVIFGWNCE